MRKHQPRAGEGSFGGTLTGPSVIRRLLMTTVLLPYVLAIFRFAGAIPTLALHSASLPACGDSSASHYCQSIRAASRAGPPETTEPRCEAKLTKVRNAVSVRACEP